MSKNVIKGVSIEMTVDLEDWMMKLGKIFNCKQETQFKRVLFLYGALKVDAYKNV